LLSSAYSGLCTSNKLKFLLGSNLTKDPRAIAPEYDKTKIIIVVTTVIIAIHPHFPHEIIKEPNILL
jgi:hypothetical protein